MILETARLVLRPFEPSDIDDYARIRAKPEVARYLPGGEAGASNATEVAERTIEHFIDEWQERGFGPWAVIEKASQNLLGHCGLRYLPEFDAVEVLYALDDSVWGKGIATEAARASLDFGFTQLNLERIIAIALPENIASRRVMEKIGLQYVKMAMFKGYEVVYYEIIRSGGRL